MIEIHLSPTLPTGEDYAEFFRTKMTNTDRSIKALEAISLFPETSPGLEASEIVMDLLDQLHQTPLNKIEDIFTGIRLIFQSFNISLDI